MHPPLPRSWDSFDTYLFDIDGTLLNCVDATHYFAFCDALKMLAGRDLTLAGVVTHGNVDNGILRDALALAGILETSWRPRLREAQQNMGAFVETHRADVCPRVLPGVREVLRHLRSAGATLAVATGNLERIGTVKLERAALLPFFDFGGWSDAHETRSAVFAAALAKGRDLRGRDSTACVVGDTPADIHAAHANGLPVIAVATGIYSAAQLSAERPEWCVSSLTDLLDTSSTASTASADASPPLRLESKVRWRP